MSGERAHLRPMIAADLAAAMYVRKYAFERLVRSEGREPNLWRPGVEGAQRHILATDPEGCWVAEVDGLVVGYAQAIVRGDTWFLSQLFVHPEVHAGGLGGELLRRSMEYGRSRGAALFSVVSSTSPVAQALYMRAGMFAFAIGYRLTGPLDALHDLPRPRDAEVEAGLEGRQDEVAALDAATFGAARRQDHAAYLGGEIWGRSASFALVRRGGLAGYGYAVDGGHIAPLAAYEPEDQLALLGAAAAWLRDREIGEGRVWALSPNQTIITALLSRGWRVSGWSFLKANRPFGRFDRYHPAGGILL